MNDELQHLKNLGKTSAQWLHAVGIHSASDLRRLGAVDAYRAVRTRGFRASKVLLYAIEGALMDVHWNDIPAERKEALNRQLDAISARCLCCWATRAKNWSAIPVPPRGSLVGSEESWLLDEWRMRLRRDSHPHGTGCSRLPRGSATESWKREKIWVGQRDSHPFRHLHRVKC